MRIKKGFVLEPVGGAYIAVAVGEEAVGSNALIRMNGTGAFLWRHLSERELDEGQLLALMLEEYDVPADIAARDIAVFIEKLDGAGLLVR